jgi:sulfur-oxidizing protein SoxZ
MADPMRVRALEKDGTTEVKILMKHDMETGLRKDDAGNIVQAHFIEQVWVKHNDREVLTAQFGTSVSKDPFLAFKFKGGVKGDKVVVSWVDTAGDKRTDEALIA